MNGHKSSSIFCCFLVFYVLMAAGCAPSPLLKTSEDLPPIIKDYKYVTIQRTAVNTGIYLNKGEPYSILVEGGGGVFLDGRGYKYLNKGFSLGAKIGQKPYFNPLSGTYYDLNGTTRIAHSEGNLYLDLDVEVIEGCGADQGLWDVAVIIIVWKADDKPKIVRFLQEMKEKQASKTKADSETINAIDDAIDRVKELREDFGFRIPDSGFAPEIVCVKNYRRVTP